MKLRGIESGTHLRTRNWQRFSPAVVFAIDRGYLAMVAQRFDHRQHFLERDETAAMA